VLSAWRERPDGKGGVGNITRLASEVKEGDLMWTRDSLGQYWLGQITGSWRYDKSPESVRLDLYNVRPCRWLEKPFRDYDVPGAVVTSFIGATQALRRIGDHPAAIRVIEMLWARESDPTAVIPPVAPEQAMVDLFEPEDVEDLVLLWLQQQGWLLIPSSRKHDTPMYEAALRHPTGELAVVSVKSGHSNPVPIPELAEAAGAARAYAYSTHDKYTAPPGDYDVIAIEHDELITFMSEHSELLPPRVARWLTP